MNLHFHGLGGSPKKPGDDVLTMIAKPGQSLHYVVYVPENQEPGLYWYHPHVHGETSYQVGENGMSGAIVVDGIERHLPGLAKMKERLIVVRATGSAASTREPDNSNSGPCTTKDSARRSRSTAPSSRRSRSRQVRNSFSGWSTRPGIGRLKLKVPGEQLEVVAIDGFALDTYPGTPATKMELIDRRFRPPPAPSSSSPGRPTVTRIQIALLQHRTEWRSRIRSWCWAPCGRPGKARASARLRVALTVGEPLPQNGYTTPLPPIAVKRLVVLSENGKPRFFINGKSYSMNDPPMFVVHIGTVEEWQIVNVTKEIHDFHIHQTHFLVEKIDGMAVEHPHWADSVVVPHRGTVGKKSVSGTLTLLMDFRDPVIGASSSSTATSSITKIKG